MSYVKKTILSVERGLIQRERRLLQFIAREVDRYCRNMALPATYAINIAVTDSNEFAMEVDFSSSQYQIFHINVSRQTLLYSRKEASMMVLEEILHIVLFPLTRLATRLSTDQLASEIEHLEESSLVHIKRGFAVEMYGAKNLP